MVILDELPGTRPRSRRLTPHHTDPDSSPTCCEPCAGVGEPMTRDDRCTVCGALFMPQLNAASEEVMPITLK